MKKMLLTAIVALTLTACAGTKINWDKARQVKEGMSEKEVTELMGAPYMVSSTGKGEQRWIWSHANAFGGAGSMSITMKDGKVTHIPDIPASFK